MRVEVEAFPSEGPVLTPEQAASSTPDKPLATCASASPAGSGRAGRALSMRQGVRPNS